MDLLVLVQAFNHRAKPADIDYLLLHVQLGPLRVITPAMPPPQPGVPEFREARPFWALINAISPSNFGRHFLQ